MVSMTVLPCGRNQIRSRRLLQSMRSLRKRRWMRANRQRLKRMRKMTHPKKLRRKRKSRKKLKYNLRPTTPRVSQSLKTNRKSKYHRFSSKPKWCPKKWSRPMLKLWDPLINLTQNLVFNEEVWIVERKILSQASF